MPRPNTAIPGRDMPGCVPHYIRATIRFDTPGIAQGVQIGTMPTGAVLGQCLAKIAQTFNAVTTNVLTCGTNAPTYDNIIGAADAVEGTAGVTASLTGAALEFAVDTPVFARYTQTGTAATQGRAILILPYACDDDR